MNRKEIVYSFIEYAQYVCRAFIFDFMWFDRLERAPLVTYLCITDSLAQFNFWLVLHELQADWFEHKIDTLSLFLWFRTLKNPIPSILKNRPIHHLIQFINSGYIK